MDEETFTRVSKLFTAPRPAEAVVVISGKHTFASQARTVLKKLVTPRDIPQAAPRKDIETAPQATHDLQPRRRNVTIN